MSDEQTLSVYAEKAVEYAGMTNNANDSDPLLSAFIRDIPSGGRVLDLGCGPGASAAVMARAGLEAHAWDPVAEMVALAAEQSGVIARQAGFNTLTETDTFDGIWANFSLLHAARDEMPGHLARIATALKPGGRFHIALKSGAGSKRDSIGRLYTYYTDTELTGLLEAAGMTVTRRAEGIGKGLDGTDAAWISLAAHA
ncbi:bifunctional 2-polyprenyl-6-hydroxyphenol methylase/3-demethylubiquinol 3-O-methyltransferase UbiG [uncultured Roseobacter sp.]|uniref:class I SAM-dependent methyltransferase n=1 Tax=uncultured Roseobacter sp. TaxID=114847 RepID=UPI00262EC356|nr:class I SAM-dependent methyltransferase [uncultured Roseobacter sp.]